jgi:hypothetical protein
LHQGGDIAFEPAKLLWLIQRDFLRKLLLAVSMIERFMLLAEPNQYMPFGYCSVLHIINRRQLYGHFVSVSTLGFTKHSLPHFVRHNWQHNKPLVVLRGMSTIAPLVVGHTSFISFRNPISLPNNEGLI